MSSTWASNPKKSSTTKRMRNPPKAKAAAVVADPLAAAMAKNPPQDADALFSDFSPLVLFWYPHLTLSFPLSISHPSLFLHPAVFFSLDNTFSCTSSIVHLAFRFIYTKTGTEFYIVEFLKGEKGKGRVWSVIVLSIPSFPSSFFVSSLAVTEHLDLIPLISLSLFPEFRLYIQKKHAETKDFLLPVCIVSPGCFFFFPPLNGY